jgi:hypothetical protein
LTTSCPQTPAGSRFRADATQNHSTGKQPGETGKGVEAAYGFAEDGRLTFFIGDAAYLFERGARGRIVESRPTRVRLLDEDGVVGERQVGPQVFEYPMLL